MRIATAIFCSFAFHAAIFFALAFVVASTDPLELATLDLSAIEFSFSEMEDETRTSAAEPLAKESARPDVLPEMMSAPDIAGTIEALAPEPRECEAVLPDEEIATVQTPEVATAEELPAASHARIDAQPGLLRAISPVYPRRARQRGEYGNVVLELLVGKDGRVVSVEVAETSGYRDLDDAAATAAWKARFKPAMSGGEPAESLVRLPLSFVLK